ncbi:hypothetical protein ACHAPJ_013503 [Fusarium lateritium]
MARSRTVWGLYESCPSNPLLTAAGIDNDIQHTAHGDLEQDSQDQWWAVYLAARKDKYGRYAMSRETFLTPVEWQAEWLVFGPMKRNPSELASHYHVMPLSSSPSSRWVGLQSYSFAYRRIRVQRIADIYWKETKTPAAKQCDCYRYLERLGADTG